MRLTASALLAAAIALTPASPAVDTAPPPRPAAPAGEYVKKGNRADTVRATLAAHGLPNREGKWYYIGPFDNTERSGFDHAYPPEKGVDLKATYPGKGGKRIAWTEFAAFAPGKVADLGKLFPDDKNWGVV